MSDQSQEKVNRRDLIKGFSWWGAAIGALFLLPGASLLYESVKNSASKGERNIKIVGSNPRSAAQGVWKPDKIVVKKGTEVTLRLVSSDVTHSFELPAFGISENPYPGKPVEVTFTADQSGEHIFLCGIYCGPGHGAMQGKFIVREA